MLADCTNWSNMSSVDDSFEEMHEISSSFRSRTRSVDTNTSDEGLGDKSMAKPKARFQCTVCGDRATGYNFGAIVCESCKSFYRRHAHRRPHFRCSGRGSCGLSKLSRRFCAACRLRKCFAVGMRVPRLVDDPEKSERRGVTSEQLLQRRLLMSRLLQRIAAKHTQGGTCDSDSADSERDMQAAAADLNALKFSLDSECSTIGVMGHNFEELYERVIAGAEILEFSGSRSGSSSPRAGASSVFNQGEINSDGIQMALADYFTAMRLFPEILSLDEPIHKMILSERLLAQVNLLVIFSTSSDMSGWSSVDASGSLRHHGFSEFIECLLRDGVDAHCYVESFRSLATTLRSKFESDWPLILMTLCLLDYFSFAYSPSCPSNDLTRIRLVDLRRTYEFFLKSYLERYYEDTCESLYRYCTDQFPWTLARLVDTQVHMLSQLLSPAGNGNGDGDGKELQFDGDQQQQDSDRSLSLPVAKIFEPVVLEVAKNLSK